MHKQAIDEQVMPIPAWESKFLGQYPASLRLQVRRLVESQQLGVMLLNKYPQMHDIQSDKMLYDYVVAMKNTAMRNALPLSKALFDSKIQILKHALGTHTTVSRVQGGKLKAKREIRIASLFKSTPEAFLRMIVTHELAHFKESDHNKAFYQLCTSITPEYHQYEFDLRVYLVYLNTGGEPLWAD